MFRAVKFATLLCAYVWIGSVAFAADEHSTESKAEHGHAEHAGGETAGHDDSHSHEHGDTHDAAADHGNESHATADHAHDDGHGHAGHGDGHGHDDHGSHGNTHPLSVDPDLALFTVLAFGLTYLVMKKFAWVPIRSALDKRDAYMASQLEEAQRQSDEAERLRKEHADKLSDASEEVRSVLDQARKEAEQEKQSILDAAQKAAAAEKAEAIAAIGAARGDALQDLADKSVDTAVGLAGKIVGRQLKKDDHSSLIDDAVKQFTKS